ncbi:MAG: hypothetical protein IKW45_09090 [Clostridia bacterium]|nr:hypothetical protein [Clostridia bacterium]
MKREFDKFTIFTLIFTFWYSLTAFIYILDFGPILVSSVGENIAYIIMWIATLGGIFSGESHSIIIAWAPILAIIIGGLGYFNRTAECKDFIILPCICLVAPLLMIIIPSCIGFLYELMPMISIIALILWVGLDLLMIAKDRKS